MIEKEEVNQQIVQTVNCVDQPLPLTTEFKRFWSLAENKIDLQRLFISWIVNIYSKDKLLYLGGCHIDNIEKCYKLVNGTITNVPELCCSYDEADDRIMFHLNHAVKVGNYSSAHVLSADLDIMVCLIYHHSI